MAFQRLFFTRLLLFFNAQKRDEVGYPNIWKMHRYIDIFSMTLGRLAKNLNLQEIT